MASSMNGTFVNIYNYKKKEIKMMVLWKCFEYWSTRWTWNDVDKVMWIHVKSEYDWFHDILYLFVFRMWISLEIKEIQITWLSHSFQRNFQMKWNEKVKVQLWRKVKMNKPQVCFKTCDLEIFLLIADELMLWLKFFISHNPDKGLNNDSIIS
jgi:hypothetical protein